MRFDYNVFGTDIVAFSTTRNGGCSTGNYASFNANYFCNDNPEHVSQNRRLLCAELGIDTSRLIVPHQIHKTAVLNVDDEFLSLKADEQKEKLEGIDALITDRSKVCIAVSTADCVPILLHDKRRKVIAAIHSGWRGTVQDILSATISEMRKHYESEAIDITAQIGPSISVDSFEVGDEVYEAFEKAGFDMNEIAERHAKWHINLWEACKIQLKQCGVATDNIHIANICTLKNKEFFSARRQGIDSGRILNGIMKAI
ncbi:MAG: peptidoglycan editing factor PgeF [Bacteroidaceae bacterium]|nr:peptidoglycan editing factor PgeF [Bacteroidaceae bacterium]